uniref:Putative secreted protein n=1 Tax=Anopheles triannulatus TaxID=58253 RepID=A0A2M4B5Q0_9DIPT
MLNLLFVMFLFLVNRMCTRVIGENGNRAQTNYCWPNVTDHTDTQITTLTVHSSSNIEEEPLVVLNDFLSCVENFMHILDNFTI